MPVICGLLLPLFWLLIFVGLFLRGVRLREGFLAASAITGLMVVFGTELLSVGKWFDLTGVLLLWSVVSLWMAGRLLQKTVWPIRFPRPTLSWFEWILVVLIVLEMVALGTIAWVSPPNNWDSMCYHMTRVMHWIDNRTVWFFPSHNLRNLHMNPLAEWCIAHLQILSGGDRFANFVQWFAMIGNMIAVSLIVRHLGGGRREQLLAAVFVVSIPIAILEATSTQNDLVAAFWLAAFVCFFLELRREYTRFGVFGAGCCLGLAVLTKATAGLYALPFLIWFFWSLRRRWPALVVIAGLCLAINAGHWTRNARVFGSPLGPGQELADGQYKYAVDFWSPAMFASNLSRNAALHLKTKSTNLNARVEKAVVDLHRWLGLDVSDPRTTWTGSRFYVEPLRPHEDLTPNPLHFLLALCAVPGCLLWKRLRTNRDLLVYGACLVAGIVLFCSVLRWQPWHTRLHLPLFVLSAPVVVVVLSQIFGRYVSASLALILWGAGTYWVCRNDSRPLVGQVNILAQSRVEQYFNNRTNLLEPYQEAVRRLQDLPGEDVRVGIIAGQSEWEYPLWILTERRIHFEHIDVKNASAVLSEPRPAPPVIVMIPEGLVGSEIIVRGVRYAKEWSYFGFGIYRQTP